MAGKTPLQLTDEKLLLRYLLHKAPRTTRDDDFHSVHTKPATGFLRTRNRVSLGCGVPPLLIQSNWDVLNASAQTFYVQSFSH